MNPGGRLWIQPLTSLRSGSLCLFPSSSPVVPLQPILSTFSGIGLDQTSWFLPKAVRVFWLYHLWPEILCYPNGKAAAGLWYLRDVIIISWSAYQLPAAAESSSWKNCDEAFPLMCAEGRDYWGACTDTDIVPSCDFLVKWSSHARTVLVFSGGN